MNNYLHQNYKTMLVSFGRFCWCTDWDLRTTEGPTGAEYIYS